MTKPHKQTQAVYVPARIEFEIMGQKCHYDRQFISSYGASGLDWNEQTGPSQFGQRFGMVVPVDVEVLIKETPFRFKCVAVVCRELNLTGETFGLHFRLDPEIDKQLKAIIDQFGTVQKSHNRKYPRVPSNQFIKNYPLRALVMNQTDQMFIFDVANLSTTGALLQSENPNTLSLLPGNRIKISFEPRGTIVNPIQTAALICRITDETDPKTGNFTRYLGVSFQEMTGGHRENFQDLMKAIYAKLENLDE